MATPKRTGSIEIEEDVPYQRKFWRVQRVGWFLMGALLFLAMLGFAGPGIIGKTVSSDPEGVIKLEYDRFIRIQTDSDMKIMLTPPQRRDPFIISASREYLDKMYIVQVIPAPDLTEAADGKVLYYFRNMKGSTVSVSFLLKPQAAGVARGSFGAENGTEVFFRQYILP